MARSQGRLWCIIITDLWVTWLVLILHSANLITITTGQIQLYKVGTVLDNRLDISSLPPSTKSQLRYNLNRKSAVVVADIQLSALSD